MPVTVLQDLSPYRTRRASLVRGDDDTYLYLEDVTAPTPRTISAVWVGNGTAAPTRAEMGSDPAAPARMLARGTRHPQGCPPLLAPRVVWFEEGDGMALVDGDQVLAVVPGWAGSDGFYGYSRWAIGRSPLAWELAGEPAKVFDEKVARSDEYWAWRLAPDARAWDEIRSDGLDHLTRCLGPAENVQEVSGGFPEIVVSRHRAGATDVWVTATTGLSAARMPGVDRHVEDPSPVSRVELAIARDRPDAPASEMLAALAGIPFGRGTWFGDGHTIGGSPGAFPDLGPDCVAVLLTATPPGHPPDLSGMERRGDPVRYLWVVGLDAAGFRISRARGAATTIARLADSGRTWVQRTVSPPVERF